MFGLFLNTPCILQPFTAQCLRCVVPAQTLRNWHFASMGFVCVCVCVFVCLFFRWMVLRKKAAIISLYTNKRLSLVLDATCSLGGSKLITKYLFREIRVSRSKYGSGDYLPASHHGEPGSSSGLLDAWFVVGQWEQVFFCENFPSASIIPLTLHTHLSSNLLSL